MRRCRRLPIYGAIGLAILLADACKRDPIGPDATPKLAACDSVANVVISQGSAPTISWSPECGLGSIAVHRAVDSAEVWAVYSDAGQLASPITFGIAPKGAIIGTPPTPLVPGQQYRLYFARANPPPPGAAVHFFTVFYEQLFTP